jgi:hypothetical protein
VAFDIANFFCILFEIGIAIVVMRLYFSSYCYLSVLLFHLCSLALFWLPLMGFLGWCFLLHFHNGNVLGRLLSGSISCVGRYHVYGVFRLCVFFPSGMSIFLCGKALRLGSFRLLYILSLVAVLD